MKEFTTMFVYVFFGTVLLLLVNTWIRGLFNADARALKTKLSVKDEQLVAMEAQHRVELQHSKRESRLAERERFLDLEERERELEARERELAAKEVEFARIKAAKRVSQSKSPSK